VSPETAVALAAGARAAGATAIDASISGSTIPAEYGELVLLVGGDRELYDRCESLFAALARRRTTWAGAGRGR
jgi:3-hydroxyisobutyrate dehydrogenase-like beta-hydroxyacid dehydrogenase